MDLKITTKEFEALMLCKAEVRYQYTLKRIADTEGMWTIIDNNNSFALQSYEDKQLFPIWSSKEYAQAFCVGDRDAYMCFAVTLDYFEEHVIDFVFNEGLLISVFPTINEPYGKIVELNTFAEDLSCFLEDYQ